MTTPHFTCCAELPPCPVCPEACEFATSYVYDGFALQFQFSVDHKACPRCSYEGGGGGGPFYQRSYSVSVDVTQIGQDTLYRCGGEGDCCYFGCGTMEVEWEITDDVIYGCCAPPNQSSPTPTVQCTGNQTITGVEAVPYNYTVSCCEAPIDGCPDDAKRGSFWVHTLELCGVVVATSHKGYVADCQNEDCGEEPRGRLYMTGMTLRWFTPLIALDAIVPGSEDAMCGPYAMWTGNSVTCTICGCRDEEDCDAVNPYTDAQFGPFSVHTLPQTCTVTNCILSPSSPLGFCQLGGVVYGTLLGDVQDCGGTPINGSVCPCGAFTADCTCHRVDAGWVAAYPNYV